MCDGAVRGTEQRHTCEAEAVEWPKAGPKKLEVRLLSLINLL